MFTGCQVASAHSQYLPRDSPGIIYPGLDVTGQTPIQNNGSMAVCSVYQGQSYTSNPQPPVLLNNNNNNAAISQQTTPSTVVPPAAIKLGQDGFKKVCRSEEDSPSPFPGLPSGILEMRVKEGSKIRNLMGFAMARMQGEKKEKSGGGGDGGLRQVVFSGSGRAVTKTITCAEIMKRKVGSLHQMTKLRYKTVKEVWESSEGGASEMTVARSVPSISILLSKDPLDPSEPGYQPPEALGALWEDKERAEPSQSTACKRPPGPVPHNTASPFPPEKRVCLGEGAPVMLPFASSSSSSSSSSSYSYSSVSPGLNLCQTVERIK